MSSALSYALRLVNRRLRSAWELDQALLRKGVELEEREAVMSEMVRFKLIDDEHYALAWIHTRDRLSPRGESVLRMELRQKHVDDEIIAHALRQRREDANDEASDQMSEEELAKVLIKGKSRAYAHLSKEVRERRLIALLMRRGFSYDVARRILEA